MSDKLRIDLPVILPEVPDAADACVTRLTGELAEWYDLDAGHLRVGDRADLVLLDPAYLDASVEEYAEAPVAQYDGLSRMVNRNDATVTAVFVGGRRVFDHGVPTEMVGRTRTGRFLRAAHRAPALPSDELAHVG